MLCKGGKERENLAMHKSLNRDLKKRKKKRSWWRLNIHIARVLPKQNAAIIWSGNSFWRVDRLNWFKGLRTKQLFNERKVWRWVKVFLSLEQKIAQSLSWGEVNAFSQTNFQCCREEGYRVQYQASCVQTLPLRPSFPFEGCIVAIALSQCLFGSFLLGEEGMNSDFSIREKYDHSKVILRKKTSKPADSSWVLLDLP